MSLIRLNRRPSSRDLRVFATLWLLFLGVGGAIAWHKGAVSTALILWAAGAAVGLAGLLFPPLARPVYLVAIYATFPIGFVSSYVLLGILYFLVLTPIGLLMRMFGHDPLHRRFDPKKTSYWVARTGAKPPSSYFHQH
jgi:hypothetical protein